MHSAGAGHATEHWSLPAIRLMVLNFSGGFHFFLYVFKKPFFSGPISSCVQKFN